MPVANEAERASGLESAAGRLLLDGAGASSSLSKKSGSGKSVASNKKGEHGQ